MVNLSRKLKLVLDPSSSSSEKINDEVAKIKDDMQLRLSTSIFSMVGDAFEGDAKIYKVNKIKKSNRQIPAFKFLE